MLISQHFHLFILELWDVQFCQTPCSLKVSSSLLLFTLVVSFICLCPSLLSLFVSLLRLFTELRFNAVCPEARSLCWIHKLTAGTCWEMFGSSPVCVKAQVSSNYKLSLSFFLHLHQCLLPSFLPPWPSFKIQQLLISQVSIRKNKTTKWGHT